MSHALDPHLVRALFTCNPDGVLIWSSQAPRNRLVGQVAGSLHPTRKVWTVVIGGRVHMRSRLVWAYHRGEYPLKPWLHHVNGDDMDDRIENLLPETTIERSIRLGLYTAENIGVTRVGNAWHAQLAGKFHSRHSTLAAASAAFAKAYEERYGTPPPTIDGTERAAIFADHDANACEHRGGCKMFRETSRETSPRPSHFFESGISAGNLGGADAL